MILRLQPSAHVPQGFTLMELLVASVAIAILIAALMTVCFRGLQLRDDATRLTDEVRVRDYVANLIRQDVLDGFFNGDGLGDAFLGEVGSERLGRADYLEFTTLSGQPSELDDFGGVQKVSYYLASPEWSTNSSGLTLVRAVQRNLLSEVEEAPVVETLLYHVQSFETAYFDGESWVDSWDPESYEGELPEGLRLRVDFVIPDDELVAPKPFELVFPWATRPRMVTNAVDEAEAVVGGGNTPPGGGAR